MKLPTLSRLSCALGLLTASASVQAGTINFGTTNFGFAWSAAPAFPSTYASGQAYGIPSSGGNGGAYLEVVTTTNSITYTAFFSSLFTYDPSAAGVIDSIDFAIDYKSFTSGTMSFGLAVKQGGQIWIDHMGPTGGPVGAWQSYSDTSSLADPDTWYGTTGPTSPGTYGDNLAAKPDFGVTGGIITFGLYTGNEGGMGVVVGYDNLSITLHTSVPGQQTPSVPDAASPAALLGLGLATIALLRRLVAARA